MAKSNNAMTGGGTSHRSHFTPSDLIVLELIVRSHELRARSVDAIAAHPAGEMCAKELAEMFDVDLSGLCYHLKEMRKGGVLEITREEKRRGAVATFYRVVPRYLDRLPDGAALDSLARCLLKEPVDVAAAQRILSQTGRDVAPPLPKSEEGPRVDVERTIDDAEGEFSIRHESTSTARPPRKKPEEGQPIEAGPGKGERPKLHRMDLRRQSSQVCTCEGSADAEGRCMSCSKPKAATLGEAQL